MSPVQGTLVAMMDQGLVAGFKEYHTVTDVEFLVKLTPDGVNAVKESEPETLFKLRRQMSLANMWVWGARCGQGRVEGFGGRWGGLRAALEWCITQPRASKSVGATQTLSSCAGTSLALGLLVRVCVCVHSLDDVGCCGFRCEAVLARHLFDGKGAIKRYDSAFEVIDEHFPVRLDLYSKRRDRQLVDLASRCVLRGWGDLASQ